MNNGSNLIGESELLAQKFDVQYSSQAKPIATLNKLTHLDWSDDPKLQEVQSIIKQWNRKADIANRSAAISITILRELHKNKDPEETSPATLRAASERAAEYLLANYGRLDPLWGEVNRLVRGEFNQPVDGGPDLLRAIYAQGHGSNEKAYATIGDTWMAVVAWAADGEQTAKVLHQFGSATLDSTSPHYADQAELFVKHQ